MKKPRCHACGGKVEPGRWCYAHPTCYACLSPPKPLPTTQTQTEAARVRDAFAETLRILRASDSRPGIDWRGRFALFGPDGAIVFWGNEAPRERWVK